MELCRGPSHFRSAGNVYYSNYNLARRVARILGGTPARSLSLPNSFSVDDLGKWAMQRMTQAWPPGNVAKEGRALS